jgi:hypothetical protein
MRAPIARLRLRGATRWIVRRSDRLRPEIEQSLSSNLFDHFHVEIGFDECAERILVPQIFVMTIPGSVFWEVPKLDRICEQIRIVTVRHAKHVAVALGRQFVDVGSLSHARHFVLRLLAAEIRGPEDQVPGILLGPLQLDICRKRGTVPLAIFGPYGCGERTGLLGAPARAAQALAPTVFGIVLDAMGASAIIVTSVLCLAALGALLCLRARRTESARVLPETVSRNFRIGSRLTHN